MTRAYKKYKEACAEPKQPKAKAEEAPGEKLPQGLAEVLKVKTELQKDLMQLANHQNLSVSIELEDDEWILITRGCQPPYQFYKGYKVVCMSSINLWAPTKSL
jgi:hypothetical protein